MISGYIGVSFGQYVREFKMSLRGEEIMYNKVNVRMRGTVIESRYIN